MTIYGGTLEVSDSDNQREAAAESKRALKFIDFCAGIGGGRLGLEQAGLQSVGFPEIDKKATAVYRKLHLHHNPESYYGDLMQIDPRGLPDFDMMIAGFPCQSFSILGKRLGLGDERGQIIHGLTDILRVKQPRYFILENVKGLVNLERGHALRTVVSLLESAGYHVSWDVLNSNRFGVPQSRERVYFVGIHHSCGNKGFSFDFEKRDSSLRDFLIETDEKYILNEDSPLWATFVKWLNNSYNKGRISAEDLRKEEYLVIDTRQSDLRLFRGHIPTLRKGRQGILYVRDGVIRKLSGKEALLLQGFSQKSLSNLSGFSDGDLLGLAGNAMTASVIHAVAERILNEYE